MRPRPAIAVLSPPAIDVTVTSFQLPITTSPLFAGMRAVVKVPWPATKVPARDPIGICCRDEWLCPHTTITLPVLAAAADLFAVGHAVPVSAAAFATTASVISH